MAEILFKVGDSGGYKDGQIISILPDGWFLSAADMLAWIDSGTEPTVLVLMPRYLSDRLKRRINRLRYYLTHTAAEIAKEFGIDEKGAALDKQQAVDDRAWMVSDGLDTNWGREDVKIHYVVKVSGLTHDDLYEYVDDEASTDHKRTPKAKRRYRVEYETQFDAAKLADIRNKELRVLVDRTTAIAKTVVKATTAEVK